MYTFVAYPYDRQQGTKLTMNGMVQLNKIIKTKTKYLLVNFYIFISLSVYIHPFIHTSISINTYTIYILRSPICSCLAASKNTCTHALTDNTTTTTTTRMSVYYTTLTTKLLSINSSLTNVAAILHLLPPIYYQSPSAGIQNAAIANDES